MSTASNTAGSRGASETRMGTTMQKVAMAFGVVFVLVGLAGFVPGITTNYDKMGAAGPDSMAMLLGVFMVSVLHNIVHLLYGVVGIIASRRWSASRAYLLFGGIVYLVLWLYGLVIDRNSSANFVPLNTADNWLHLGLGVVMVGAALALSRERDRGTGHAAA